jgi:hypothetical protein
MAGLEWQTITIPLQAGVDTKRHADAFPPLSFEDLRNVDFREVSALTKAPGWASIGLQEDGSGLLSSYSTEMRALSTWKKQNIVWCKDGIPRTRVIDGEHYTAVNSQWSRRQMDTNQTVNPFFFEADWLQHDVGIEFDLAVGGNSVVCAWREPNSGICWYQIRDRHTGAIILTERCEVSNSTQNGRSCLSLLLRPLA